MQFIKIHLNFGISPFCLHLRDNAINHHCTKTLLLDLIHLYYLRSFLKIKLQDINCDRMIENGLKLYLVEHEVATYDVTSCTGNSWETIEARVHALIVYLLLNSMDHSKSQLTTFICMLPEDKCSCLLMKPNISWYYNSIIFSIKQ